MPTPHDVLTNSGNSAFAVTPGNPYNVYGIEAFLLEFFGLPGLPVARRGQASFIVEIPPASVALPSHPTPGLPTTGIAGLSIRRSALALGACWALPRMAAHYLGPDPDVRCAGLTLGLAARRRQRHYAIDSWQTAEIGVPLSLGGGP